jgi:RND family efflux transporter MFP subunit
MKTVLSYFSRFAATAIMVSVAAMAAWQLWTYYTEEPWTRDGRVRADVVPVAPDVPGLVSEVLVHENQEVRKGEVLFKIDQDRFVLALRQAEAVVASRRAAFEETTNELNRYRQLSDRVVSQQKFEQVLSTQQQAAAAYEQAIADRDTSKLNLVRSEVRASVNGIVTNFDLRPGVYVSAGKGVFALVDEDSFHVDGYFEETKLPHIRIGDPVNVYLMGEKLSLTGHVESIAAAIEDRERSPGTNLVANVNPTFNWVRLAQRVPVRIALTNVPKDILLLSGRTATVVIKSQNPDAQVLSISQLLRGAKPDHDLDRKALGEQNTIRTAPNQS